ncbi:hypothetical protein JCM11641_000833 [Rhodosporidiobolus odoratus]
MVHLTSLASLLPLAALSLHTFSATLAADAPPNPDQLPIHGHAPRIGHAAAQGKNKPHVHGHSQQQHEAVKRHLDHGAFGQHHHRQRQGRAIGMQRRPASERKRSPAPAPPGLGAAIGGRKEDVREPRRRGVVDSSSTPDDVQTQALEASDLEARDGVVEPRAGEQYYLASSAGSASSIDYSPASVVSSSVPSSAPQTAAGVSTQLANSTSSYSPAAAVSSPSSSSSYTSNPGPSVSGAWKGVSSYYLFALSDSDRVAVLDAIKGGGFKVVRIFVASVEGNNKGSGNAGVRDLEAGGVGTYDDTILEKIDQLMVECQARGLKLLIALSDRYALGYWSTDSYALKLNIATSGSSGAQKIANAAPFYMSTECHGWFDARLKHIMTHKNDQMGGKSWAELEEVIYAVEPQNEPQGHMPMASSTWACQRASYLKSLLPSNSAIKISSGGGITTSASLGDWALDCDAFDVVSVHDYGTNAWNTAGTLASAQAKYPGKEIVMGEWGAAGANKAATISSFVSAFAAKSIPWMYWQITKPGAGADDFEVWTNEAAWKALTGQQQFAYSSVAPSTTVVKTSTALSHVAASSSSASSSPHWSPASSLAAVAASERKVYGITTTTTAQWHKATSSFVGQAKEVESQARQGADEATSAVASVAVKATSAAAAAVDAAASKASSW